MKKFKYISSSIIFTYMGNGILRDVVHEVCKKFGFTWQENCNSEDWLAKPLIIVGRKDDIEAIERRRGELLQEKFRGAEDEWYYPAEFYIELDGPGTFHHYEDEDDFESSLTEWMTDELDFYGNRKFIFCDGGKMSKKETDAFARQFNRAAEKMTKYLWLDEERISHFKDSAIYEIKRKKEEFIRNGTWEENSADLDLVHSVIKDDLKVDIIEAYDTFVWNIVARFGLNIVCGYLLELNVKSCRSTTDMSPMMEAVVEGNMQIVEMMLRNGWDSNEWTDIDYDTPLRLAAASGSENMFFLLVKNGAKLFLDGRDYEITDYFEGEQFSIGPDDILLDALKGKNVKICKYLISHTDLGNWPKIIPRYFWDGDIRDFCLNCGIPELESRYKYLEKLKSESLKLP